MTSQNENLNVDADATNNCPICGMADGFHDRPHFDVPPEFFKEKGWHEKKKDDE